jgi:FkbM family methyltransferase
LNENIKLNNLENIQTFQFAVSDREGTAVLNTCTSHNGLHTMGKTPNFTANPINIETRTLDNLFKDVPFHLLKIDTEGHEFFVLSGGINVIRKYKPIIQIEWSPHNMRQCGITQTMLMSIIEILDYRIANLFEEEMIIVPR